jgi:hypothetical protein
MADAYYVVMRRIITLTALALGLTGGVAAADRHDRTFGGNHERGGRDRVVVRTNNNNWNRGGTWNRGGNYNTGNRGYRDNRSYIRVERTRPVWRNNGYYFGGNIGFRTYHRPVINVRYRDYYRRPALVVENYDPVPGYIWIQGNWNWSGYEWVWTPGHYDIDQSYDQSYDQTYDGGYYSE